MKNRCFAIAAMAAMAALAQEPAGLDEVLARVARYEYGQSRTPLSDLSALVRKAMASPAATREVESALDRLLESDATLGGKEAACRELSLMGSEKSVPALMKMMTEERPAEIARYALERIPGAKVDAELRAFIGGKGSAKTKVGVINTLGRRRDRLSVPILKPLLAGSDEPLALAAADALAKIADAPARAALSSSLSKSSGERRLAFAEAYIRCADRLVQENQKTDALAIYKTLYKPAEPVMVRISALNGMASASAEAALPVLSAAVKESDPKLRAAAIRTLGGLPGAAATKALAGSVAELPPEAQVQALTALAARGDTAALPVLQQSLNSSDSAVRIAALEGLGRIGGKDTVMLLAKTAAAAEGEQQEAARRSLNMLRGRDADQQVVAGLSAAADSKIRLELIRAAGERGIRAAATPLLEAAKDGNPEIRREAVRALRDTAEPPHTPALIALVVDAKQSSERRDAQRALLSAVRQSKQSRGPELASACRGAADTEAKTALMDVMAQTGADDTLPFFREVLAKGDDDARRAGINALSQWTSAAPAPDLLEIARGGASPAHRILALRGYIRLVALPADRPAETTAKMLGSALELASQPAEKRAVLAALQRVPSPESLRLAESVLNDAAVAQEAKTAVSALKRALSQR